LVSYWFHIGFVLKTPPSDRYVSLWLLWATNEEWKLSDFGLLFAMTHT